MDALFVLLLAIAGARGKRLFCDGRTPLQLGEWSREFTHLDTANIENPPVSVLEGQTYIYENVFPNYTIQYIDVDNLAVKSCGAAVSIRAGGVNDSGVLIVLHSAPYHEIRSVIDIWGTRTQELVRRTRKLKLMKLFKTNFLFNGLRIVNHNYHNDDDYEK